MAAPTRDVREIVYARDDHRCVACGAVFPLTFQHRRRVGAGGSKIRPSIVDGCTLCATCNTEVEGYAQTAALVYGWKAQEWTDPAVVPMFDRSAGKWFLLLGSGRRVALVVDAAIEQMRTVYGPEKWDAWAEQLERPIGLKGRVG